jgi:4-hydroxy-tetrahydrodipicolinate synthase
MLDGGNIDYKGFEKLLEYQMEYGIKGIVVLGTTGESPTVEEPERKKLIKLAVKKFAGHVIVGTGTNYTKTTLRETKVARDLGADAALVVTPYYNKPNTRGLVAHFHAAADIMPLIVYDIKGRTGRQIEIDEFQEIAAHPNVVGIKAASGDINQIRSVVKEVAMPLRAAGRNFKVWSGDDSMTVPVRESCGNGVISVVSNINPYQIGQIAETSDIERARMLSDESQDLVSAAFTENNPVAIKHMMWSVGLIESAEARPPLGPLKPENQELVERVAKKYFIKNR